MRRTVLSILVLAALAAQAMAAEAPLPRDSVYQSGAQLTDSQAHSRPWRAKRGQPQIVSMFYTSCKFVCPMIVDGARAIEQQLDGGSRAHLGVTLISLDPSRDTPEALARMASERNIDTERWTLARPDPKDVRGIAALLGVRYRALAGGEFNHNAVLVLLDADGRVVARTERVGGRQDPEFVAAVRRTLALG